MNKRAKEVADRYKVIKSRADQRSFRGGISSFFADRSGSRRRGRGRARLPSSLRGGH